MPESVVADFIADALYDDTYRTDPERSRVILSRDRLVVASEDRRIAIDLSDVFDVIVSRIPKDLADFFDQTVLIGYTQGNARRTLLVKGDHDRIDKFALYLYKATLQGHAGRIKHPARKGGRLVDTPLRSARIFPQPRAVEFQGDDLEFSIDLAVVTDISHVRREVDGASRPVLSVQHMPDSGSVTTEITHGSVRKLNILARYLRLRYFQLEEKIETIDIGPEETELLVALYSGGQPGQLAAMLDHDDAAVDGMLEDLEEKGLLTDATEGELTTWGRMVVSNNIEDINL